jgi:hypothetical protein
MEVSLAEGTVGGAAGRTLPSSTGSKFYALDIPYRNRMFAIDAQRR